MEKKMERGRDIKKADVEDVETHLEEAIGNIKKDRAITFSLLTDVITYMKKSEDRLPATGPVAAKYLETLQRSNEQLVKICGLLQKKKSSSGNFTEKDKSEIFDILQGGES